MEAQTKFSGYAFSIEPLLGVIYGQAEEIVYKYPDSDIYMSELLWDLKPLLYAGFSANFGLLDPFSQSGFIADGSIKTGLPIAAGIMEDRDWEYDDHSLTKYSRHDAKSRGSFIADFSFGYSLRASNYLSLAAFIEFSYMHYSWSAINGYYQYLRTDMFGNVRRGQIWTPDIPKEYLQGEVIKYKQNWFILSPGVSFKSRFNRYFSLDGFFNYSPLIFCADRDDHLLTKTVYLDYNYFGHYINGGGMFIVSPKRNLDFSLYFSYRHITGTRGDMFKQNSFHEGLAGTAYSAMDMGMKVTYRLRQF